MSATKPKLWSPAALDKVEELLKEGANAKQVAETINSQFDMDISWDSARKALTRVGRQPRVPREQLFPTSFSSIQPSHVEEVMADQDLNLEDYDIVNLRVSNWDAQQKGGGITSLRATQVVVRPKPPKNEQEDQAFLESLIALSKRPSTPVKPDYTVYNDEMVVVFSDLHIGKEATTDTTGENFIYNTQIALERWRVWLDEVKKIILVRKPTRLILACAGDGAEGSQMRDGQGYRIDCTVGKQSRILTDVLVTTTKELRELVEALWVVVVAGNHGRIGDKGVGLVEDNVEIIVGHGLTHVFADDPTVRVTVSTTPEIIVKAGGKNILICHGDKITNKSELAHWKYVTRQEDAWDCHIDIMVSAHWHCYCEYHDQNRICFGNGGFDGGACDFARNQIVANERPEQLVFGVRPEMSGVAWREIIPVADVRSPRTILE